MNDKLEVNNVSKVEYFKFLKDMNETLNKKKNFLERSNKVKLILIKQWAFSKFGKWDSNIYEQFIKDLFNRMENMQNCGLIIYSDLIEMQFGEVFEMNNPKMASNNFKLITQNLLKIIQLGVQKEDIYIALYEVE